MLFADGPCDTVAGAAGEYCKDGSKNSGGGSDALNSLDPLHQLAQKVAEAADWTARHLGTAITDRNAVDFTNQGFLQQYAVVFAASTILVLILWLLAVAKRAVRGVPMTTAFSEAIGLLWIAVGAAAFTPLILYTLVNAVSGVTDVLVSALGGEPGGVFASLGTALKDGKIGGGPIIQIAASLLTIALCGAIWLLLVLRAMSLYAGALLGVVVYSGLVDKDLWGHIRRWAALMVGLILIEPIVVIILGLAAALENTGEQGPVVTGLGISAAALGAAAYLIFKFPGFGDSIQVARKVARTAGGATRAVTGGAPNAAVGVQRGISTHGDRGGSVNGTSRNGTPRPSNPATGGIGAHGNRTPKPKPKDDK
ncbi:hypothetical protein [Streptomyces griseiscabiei]|uniref:Integral membrane protein n=1 Tax=Streptomyces griseiscabiei TaxID=2993540 RepID=A0ABU4LM74_9ACTN|nr:hypothetical protein [Streptomyces griseiscabiei]MBP5866071.1 hypothetical protein [Streptomyces sp. LBUM 1484]MBZ3908812.1 hypothetical protein [Streptomyces griseiscabiei]MDX2916088.1 hypothetical protein [Streptomyces griseiscabiei]